MKTLLKVIAAVVLSIACGIAAGSITVNQRVTQMKEHLSVSRTVDLVTDYEMNESFSKKDTTEQQGTPRFEVVGGAVHEFGSMEREEEKSFAFKLKNTGDAPGLLKLIRTSCKCTLSKELGKASEVAAGEIKEIELTWKPVNYAKEFEQTAIIKTEDPDNTIIELRVRGMVIQPILAVPETLSLAGLPVDRETTHKLKLLAFRIDDLKILSHELLVKKLADKFEIETRPLTEEELEKEKGVKSGQLITVTAKAGLPFGLTRQKLRLETNMPGDEADIEVPILTSVQSEVRVTSADQKHRFSPLTNRVEMGAITRGNPEETTLNLLIKPTKDGPEKIEMKVLQSETVPTGGIIAEIGESRKLGPATRIPLKIRIPDDQPAVALQGSVLDEKVGVIVVETNLKTAERITIYVSYAKID